MSDRGRISAIRDPALAIAAAKCWLARWQKGGGIEVGGPLNAFHPRECSFCDFPGERLGRAVIEFNDWAGLRPPVTIDEIVPVRSEVERFLMLPREERNRLVSKAQGYLGEEG